MSANAVPSPAQQVAALSLLARTGRPFETRLTGVSMGSAIPDGAVVRIVPGGPGALVPGDVFAFSDETRIVAHRLVWCGRRGEARRYVIALGDGNRFPDPPVPLDAIFGKVVAHSHGETWREVPPPQLRSPLDQVMTAAAVLAMIVATEIHVPLAKWMAGFTIFK